MVQYKLCTKLFHHYCITFKLEWLVENLAMATVLATESEND